MNNSDAKAYTTRWEAVARIKQEELQTTSFAEKWRQLNAIRRRAARLGITREQGRDGEMAVFLLWAKLKANYVPN